MQKLDLKIFSKNVGTWKLSAKHYTIPKVAWFSVHIHDDEKKN